VGLAHSPSIVTNGLVLCLDAGNRKSYPGSEMTWTDLSGRDNTATLNGGPTYNSGDGGYIDFAGDNDYALIPYTSTLAPTSQITFEAVAYLSDWNTTRKQRIISKTQVGGWQIGINEDTITAGFVGGIVYLGGAYRQAKVGRSTISPGWHYLSFTCDGRYFKMYIDGVNVSTYDHGSIASISYSVNNSMMIGAEPGNGNDVLFPSGSTYLLGRVSVVRVYNKGLTEAEVQQNFNALRGRFGI